MSRAIWTAYCTLVASSRLNVPEKSFLCPTKMGTMSKTLPLRVCRWRWSDRSVAAFDPGSVSPPCSVPNVDPSVSRKM